jgi:hypothetical protein
MSPFDVYIGQQSWADYVSNRDLARRFENSLVKSGDRLAIQLDTARETPQWSRVWGPSRTA